MSWQQDKYIRGMLDSREKWVTVISVTAASAMLLFLADRPHAIWLNIGPMFVGAIGSLFVLVINCYYKQAELIASATGNKARQKRIRGTSDQPLQAAPIA
jgi:hypothetical protein